MGNYNWDINKLRYLSGLAEQPNRKSKAINEEGETVDNQRDKLTLLERIEQEYDGGELDEQGIEDQRMQDAKALMNGRKQMGFFPALNLAGVRNLYPNNGNIITAFISSSRAKGGEATMAETKNYLQQNPRTPDYHNEWNDEMKVYANEEMKEFMDDTNRMVANKMKVAKK